MFHRSISNTDGTNVHLIITDISNTFVRIETPYLHSLDVK